MQYNKTFLMQINKDLEIRQNALPVLQSKEAALRAETRRMRIQIKEIAKKVEAKIQSLKSVQRLWSEFPDIIHVKKVNFKTKKIASIKVGIVESIEYDIGSFELFAHPAWFMNGLHSIKEVLGLKIEVFNLEKVLESVEYARRKTTQKVNLYEKVQIPFFEEAMRKIKRFLEDEENLSKSSQKVIKRRMEEASIV
ncbi:MAG: V-type ATP synthase subunit D [Candidatus Omnitrophota bacterium]